MIKINKKEKSVVEIEASISWDKWSTFESKALDRIGQRIEIPGFRKDHIPKEIVSKHVNEMALLEEMAESAISSEYGNILEENKIDAIGRPQISITKIARGNELEFKIETAVLPEVTLADYKKIAKSENSKEEYKEEIKVEDAEIEKVLKDLQKMRAHQKMHESMPEGEQDNHDHGEMKDEDLPALDDEFAKSLGKFETLEALKEKVKENITTEKNTAKGDKKRLVIVEEILKDTKAEIPEILIEAELEKMLYKMEADVANAGFSFDEYLKQINKTKDEMKTEWREDAEKRAKLQMVIHKIAEKENLKPSKEEIEKEAKVITEMYKEADPIRAEAYVDQMLTNEKVFSFLDSQ